VAIDAAVRDVDLPAAFGHAGLRRGIGVGSFLVHLRIELSDLDARDERKAGPRKREGAEEAQN
jgi:hypothetical protein